MKNYQPPVLFQGAIYNLHFAPFINKSDPDPDPAQRRFRLPKKRDSASMRLRLQGAIRDQQQEGEDDRELSENLFRIFDLNGELFKRYFRGEFSKGYVYKMNMGLWLM